MAKQVTLLDFFFLAYGMKRKHGSLCVFQCTISAIGMMPRILHSLHFLLLPTLNTQNLQEWTDSEKYLEASGLSEEPKPGS